MTALEIGSTAPNFTLPDHNNNPVSLSDFRGKKSVVLFFYPKAFTGGCTAEVCAFRDSHEVFQEAGAEVIGVSQDSVATQDSFAQRYHLQYKLLSDKGGMVWKQYGIPKWMGLLPGRVTFVIDREGVIQHIFNSQLNFKEHVNEALHTLKTLA